MHSGEGKDSRDRFIQLSNEDQAAIIEFLQTLEILHAEPQSSLISQESQTYSSYLIILTGIVLIFIFLFILKRTK